MVQAAQTAVCHHPHWKAELARLQPRLGRNKAVVAIARKLLVAVWHILYKKEADRFADPVGVARKLLNYAYALGKENRPKGLKGTHYVRQQLDMLGIGAELKAIPWGPNRPAMPMPPSTLMVEKDAVLRPKEVSKDERRPKQDLPANSA